MDMKDRYYAAKSSSDDGSTEARIRAQVRSLSYKLPGMRCPRNWTNEEGKAALLDAIADGAKVEEVKEGIFVAIMGDEKAVVGFTDDFSKILRVE